MTRATDAGRLPLATCSRDRVTRCLTPSLAMLPPRSRARRSYCRAPAPARGRASELLLALALVLAGEGGLAALQELVAPGVVEGLRDLRLAADVLDRPVAPEAGQDDLQLALGTQLAVLALLCQLDLLWVERPSCESPRMPSSGLRPSSASERSRSGECQRGDGVQASASRPFHFLHRFAVGRWPNRPRFS